MTYRIAGNFGENSLTIWQISNRNALANSNFAKVSLICGKMLHIVP